MGSSGRILGPMGPMGPMGPGPMGPGPMGNKSFGSPYAAPLPGESIFRIPTLKIQVFSACAGSPTGGIHFQNPLVFTVCIFLILLGVPAARVVFLIVSVTIPAVNFLSQYFLILYPHCIPGTW